MDFKRSDSVALSTSATNELAVCWNHCFRKVVSYDMWLSKHRYYESQFLKFSVKHQKRG